MPVRRWRCQIGLLAACVPIAAAFAPTSPSAAQGPPPSAPDASAVPIGVPQQGAPGIVETVAQIMARNKPVVDDGEEHEGPEPQYPDRSNLPQAPECVGPWPHWPWDGNWNTTVGTGTPRYPGLFAATGFGPRNPQTPSTSFLGNQSSDNGGIFPPDTGGGVGPTQIMVVTNGVVRVY